MPRIDISIAGRNFPVSCAEGEEERVAAIAGQIDSRIQEMRRNVASATDMHLLVMASLMMGDEILEMRSELDRNAAEPAIGQQAEGDASDDAAEIAAAIGHLADRVESLVDHLSEA